MPEAHGRALGSRSAGSCRAEVSIMLRLLKKKISVKHRDTTREVRTKAIGYIVAAFGLVAGLAWNDAIRSFIEHVFPLSKDSLAAKFIYAILVTAVVVVVSVMLVRAGESDGGKGKKK